jgi:phospholipid transport system substrate-binding protein
MKISAAVSLALLLSMQAVTPAPASDDPAARVQETVDKVLTILKDPRLRGDAREQQRYEKLKTVLHERFDFAEMAKRSLGPEWNRRTAAEQAEFVRLFTDLLERAYLKTIEDVEQVRIVDQRVDGPYAEVETRLVDNKGVEFVVMYRLHNTGGDWKVYDVVVDHVSLVANYRTQFNRVLSRYSYEELIRRMKSRSEFTAPANKRNKVFGATKHQP